MPMPNLSLTVPLLGDELRHDNTERRYYEGENKANKELVKAVRFRDPIIETRSTRKSQPSDAPKSILKNTSAIQASDSSLEYSPIEPTTAGIIRQIQEKYPARNSLIAQKKILRQQREDLAKEVVCCENAGCTCCVTTTLSSVAVATTSAITVSCSPWSALLALPCCLSICFWKKSGDAEKKIRANIRDAKAINFELAPLSERMQR
jgi:hypothetical protein